MFTRGQRVLFLHKVKGIRSGVVVNEYRSKDRRRILTIDESNYVGETRQFKSFRVSDILAGIVSFVG